MEYAPHMIWTNNRGIKMLLAKTSYGEQIISDHETSAVDPKGRKIGFRASITPTTYRPPEEGEECYGLRDMDKGYGLVYRAEIQVTKDGRRFGASQPHKEFSTEEDAAGWIRRTVEERRAKYERAPLPA